MPAFCKFESQRRAHQASMLAANKRFISLAFAMLFVLTFAVASKAERLQLTDGTIIEADEAWEDGQGIWYRQGGLTRLIERKRVRAIEHTANAKDANAVNQKLELKTGTVAKTDAQQKVSQIDSARTASNADAHQSAGTTAHQPVWIYLVGGARVEADEVTETAEGAWARRGNLSIFFEQARIERIERETKQVVAAGETPTQNSWRARGWSTGNARLDELIKTNGARQGVDPYLIFCVMEQESHFNARAVSPVGARGLMQLMPGTGARFGVRKFFDASENVAGGTRYLKQLLQQFGGRVELVLASYNAGEGAVIKYGGRVPPYRETRNYVQRISARYKQNERRPQNAAAVAAKQTTLHEPAPRLAVAAASPAKAAPQSMAITTTAITPAARLQ